MGSTFSQSGEFANGIRPFLRLMGDKRVFSGRTKAQELEQLLPWAWQAERRGAAVHASTQLPSDDACC